MTDFEPATGMDIPANPLLGRLTAGDVALDSVTVRGYVGESATEGAVTLYPSLNDLSLSVEIARADIVQFVPATEAELPHDGMIVWLRQDAKVTVRSTVKVRADQLREVTRRPTLMSPAAGAMERAGAAMPEVRKGRLLIQTPAARAVAAECMGDCMSICNCSSHCCVLQPPN